MEGTDAPKWGSGLPLAKLNPYPANFTTLFPVAQRPTGIATTNFLSTARLAPPTAHIRQPAWNRVAIPPHSSTSFKGLIMKRVGLCTPKPASTAFVTPKPEKIVPEKDADAYRYPRPRTLEYEPSEEEHRFEGVPLSRATMAHMMMTAITNVANNFMTTSSDTSLAEKKDYRKGRHVQIAPAKRHIDYAETETAATGNKLTNYTDLVPILWRALQNGLDEVDMKTASFAQASALLHEFRRNPRRHLAANGVPDLSDITDLTEPESPTIVRAPIITAESRSPQKRIARLTTPLKNGNRRVNDNMVRLEPIAASPRAEPSPTKSSSVPSTPLQVSATSPVPIITQPGVQSSPLPRVSLTAPVELSPPVAANSPGRVFRAPSYSDFSSSYMEHLSPIPQSSSPIKHDRPVAPTPSRWTRADPSTPHHLTPIPSTPQTNETPIGLASFVAPATPQLPLPSNYHHFETPTQESEPIEFRFGDASPSFSGMSWMNTSAQTNEPQRVTKLNSRRRRQSEPLLRKYMKREARRRTSSPHKVSFHGDDTFRHDVSIASLFTTVSEASEAEVTNKAEPVDEPIPTVVVESTESPIKDVSTNDDLAATTDIAPPTEDHTNSHASKQSDILNIDMRENPDIFGSLTSSPPTSRYASMASLAQIAGNSCCGQAKVVITHENGKLMVRFKLPTDYAYMFPESQGSDESHFSTSPSAISSSPRITFKAPRSSATFATISSPEDRTIQFSTPSALAAFDQTPTMTGRQFADTPNQNTVSFAGGFDQTPTMTGRQFADTPTQNTVSLPNGFDQTPTVTGRQFADTSSQQASSPAKADRTLTIGELGINSFGPLETPSPKRFSMSPVKRTPIVRTPEVTEPGSASSTLFPNLTASAKPLSPLEQTPKEQFTPTQEATRNEIIVNTPAQESAQEEPTQAPSPVQETPVQKTGPVVEDSTLTILDSINVTPLNSSVPTPSPKPSFTPVNQSALKTMITASPRASSATRSKDHATPPTITESATAPTSRADDYDSPGRAYMRDFIKRSRPKRPSTTETGSPIAPPTKRLPLGVKSPNTPSPQKNKRKLDAEGNEEPSPAKPKEPTPKRVRRTKSTRQKSQLEIDMNDDPATEITEEAPAQQIEDAENEEDTAEMDSAPATRRSTRLRSLRPTTAAAKSSIPTAIKLNRSGAGRAAGAVLNSALRSEQQELVNQTRHNTRKNKGNAAYPKQVLAKFALQSAEESDEAETEAKTVPKEGKKIGWKTPLESFQEEKPKETKAAPKTKVTLGKTGIAKPKTTTRTKRTSKVAESLGMVANGTPAKPQRMTRSRTRSQT